MLCMMYTCMVYVYELMIGEDDETMALMNLTALGKDPALYR